MIRKTCAELELEAVLADQLWPQRGGLYQRLGESPLEFGSRCYAWLVAQQGLQPVKMTKKLARWNQKFPTWLEYFESLLLLAAMDSGAASRLDNHGPGIVDPESPGKYYEDTRASALMGDEDV